MKKIINLGKSLYQKYRTFVTYIFSAGLSFVLDLALFTLFFNYLDSKVAQAIILASFIARFISSFINYLVNKHLVFQNKSKEKSSLYQYIALVIFNITLSSILVSSLAKIFPIYPTIIKFFIECGIFVSNFFIQKFFIFNENKKENKWLRCLILPIISFIAIFIKDNLKGLNFQYTFLDYLNMLVVIGILFFLFIIKKPPWEFLIFFPLGLFLNYLFDLKLIVF